MEIKDLLFEHYLAFQKESGGIRSQKEFAERIGIGEVHLNRIMNNKRGTGKETIELFAKVFNDMRFYDVVGLPRPDPQLQLIIHSWKNIPKKVRDQISEDAAPYNTKEEK